MTFKNSVTTVKKGMSVLGLLVAISLFGLIFLSFNQWAAYQRKSAVNIYQNYQAVQIAENQFQRQYLGLGCENSVRQNGVQFHIKCQERAISVRVGEDEISIKTQ